MKKKFRNKGLLNNIIMFIMLFVTFFTIQKIFNIGISKYYFDVQHYNSIGESLFAKGHYSIFTISTGFRGFVFPSFMGLCSFIDEKLGMVNSIHILSSVVYAILFMVYFKFCKEMFYKKNEKKEKNI